MGKANREANVPPVLELREHLTKWRLLRKLNGRLVLAPAGRRALDRPGDLWDLVIKDIFSRRGQLTDGGVKVFLEVSRTLTDRARYR
ncbi:hypothetical protein ACFRAU_04955 [Arthrobacter sp. NPDC056691]|uniref:hypothetical protein n=1 Tax=Arthrobacter sp. NPDC056691 TaxID=3345913 RepID=UPI0036714BCA